LDRISWSITPRSRVGLVGDNGAGKTTLLRVIAGEAEYDGGSVTMPKDHKIGYLPQDLVEIDEMPLLGYLKRRAGLEVLARKLSDVEHEMATLEEGSQELRSLLS